MAKRWRIGPKAPIRALTVGAAHLEPADQVAEQISLFDLGILHAPGDGEADRARRERLEAVVDLLRKKHGEGAISLGFREGEGVGPDGAE